jgi:hypothetical protein
MGYRAGPPRAPRNRAERRAARLRRLTRRELPPLAGLCPWSIEVYAEELYVGPSVALIAAGELDDVSVTDAAVTLAGAAGLILASGARAGYLRGPDGTGELLAVVPAALSVRWSVAPCMLTGVPVLVAHAPLVQGRLRGDAAAWGGLLAIAARGLVSGETPPTRRLETGGYVARLLGRGGDA